MSELPKIYAYVAGPLNGSGDQHVNIRHAVDIAERLRRAGIIPFVPHLYAAQWAFLHPEHGGSVWLHQLDRAWLEKCDIFVYRNGVSPGTDQELIWAQELGMLLFPESKIGELISDFSYGRIQPRTNGTRPVTKIITMKQLQKEMKPWQEHNFGDRPDWQPLLGLCEEAGELADAVATQNVEEMHDGAADYVIFASDYCNALGWDLHTIWNDGMRSGMPVYEDPLRALMVATGKIQHHHLKAAQGIRGSVEDHRERGKDALAKALHALALLLGSEDALAIAVARTWKKVSQRDWKKNPKDAAAKVEGAMAQRPPDRPIMPPGRMVG